MTESPRDDAQFFPVLKEQCRVSVAQIVEPLTREAGTPLVVVQGPKDVPCHDHAAQQARLETALDALGGDSYLRSLHQMMQEEINAEGIAYYSDQIARLGEFRHYATERNAFGGGSTEGPRPAGTVTGGTVTHNGLAYFATAMGSAAANNIDPTHWIVSATEYQNLLSIKEGGTAVDGSLRPLLTPALNAGGRPISTIFGLPVLVTPNPSAGTALLIDAKQLIFVKRTGVEMLPGSVQPEQPVPDTAPHHGARRVLRDPEAVHPQRLARLGPPQRPEARWSRSRASAKFALGGRLRRQMIGALGPPRGDPGARSV